MTNNDTQPEAVNTTVPEYDVNNDVNNASNQPVNSPLTASEQFSNKLYPTIANGSLNGNSGVSKKPRKQQINPFAVAGIVLAILSALVALWPISKWVSPFGIIGLSLTVIAYFTVNDTSDGTQPSAMNKAMVMIAGLLSILAIIITPFVNLM